MVVEMECKICGKTERTEDDIRYRPIAEKWLCGRCFRQYNICSVCGKLELTITSTTLPNFKTTYLCVHCIRKPVFITWW